MKTIIAAVIAATAIASLATAADAYPHRHHMRMCSFRHHHRICTWGWR